MSRGAQEQEGDTSPGLSSPGFFSAVLKTVKIDLRYRELLPQLHLIALLQLFSAIQLFFPGSFINDSGMTNVAWGPPDRSLDTSGQPPTPSSVNVSFGSIRRPSMAKLEMIKENEQTIIFNDEGEPVAMEQPTLLVKVTVCLLAAIAIVICLGMLFIKFD
uniref:Uncharacterized protein n=1 Tax=Steinernema glaseri TaxID=37863 RepID=A0A1I8A282_9BILA